MCVRDFDLELYGFDVVIDRHLKPWLLEVNASPSLTANTEEDYAFKFDLLNDVLDVVNMEGKGVQSPHSSGGTSVGGFEVLVVDGKRIKRSDSVLGTRINRPAKPGVISVTGSAAGA